MTATANGVTTTHNLFGLDLISQDDGTQTRTLLADGLGSVRVEAIGNSIESAATYEPFGTALVQTGNSSIVYRFAGEAEDVTTGLLYLRARYYNPMLRVFISRDPWRGDGQRPPTLHGYSYVYNNPVNLTDPTGLDAWWCDGLSEPAAAECWKTWLSQNQYSAAQTEPLVSTQSHNPICSTDFPAPVTGLVPPPGWIGSQRFPPNCADLLKEIIKLRNELVKRYADLRENRLNLPQSGKMSIEGHQEQFSGKQNRLQSMLNTYNTNGCGSPPSDAWSWATVPVPSPAPQNNASPVVVNPNPAIGISLSPETVENAGKIGIAATLTAVGGYILYNAKGCILGPFVCALDLATPFP